uniref:CSON004284 protein n=1 Tax=Culicoides sonorensis TaxID=179676 RepID=A0A336MUQ3_CULSO
MFVEEAGLIGAMLNRTLLIKQMINSNNSDNDNLGDGAKELNDFYSKSSLQEQQIMDEKLSNKRLENEVENLKQKEMENDMMNMKKLADARLKEINQLVTETCTLKNDNNHISFRATELNSDISILKKELIEAEKIRLLIETEKKKMEEKLVDYNQDKDKVQHLMCQIQREKDEVCLKMTSINRKNENLSSEVLRYKQKLEQASQINRRLNLNIEELIKQNESKQSGIEKLEKSVFLLEETIRTLGSEKNSAEERLCDSLSTIDERGKKIIQLETQLKEQTLNSENIAKLLNATRKEQNQSEKNLMNLKIKFTSDISKLENDFIKKLEKLKLLIDDNIKHYNIEKSQLQDFSEKRLQQALSDIEKQKNIELEKSNSKINLLQEQLKDFIQQHEEALIREENEKQSIIHSIQKEKHQLVEHLNQAIQNLENERVNHSKSKREAMCQQDQNKKLVSSLKEEILISKNEVENLKLQIEDLKHSSNIQNSKFKDEKDKLFRDLSELKTLLKLELIDGLRKDLMDSRKQLTEVSLERSSFAETSKKLKENLKQLESYINELKNNIEDNINKIKTLEISKNNICQENDTLLKSVKEQELEAIKAKTSLTHIQEENEKLKNSLAEKEVLERELRLRLNTETEERDRLAHQLIHATKQITDLEQLLNTTRQELHRAVCQANQDRNKWNKFECGLQNQYDETRLNEQKLQDKKHNLEICLADATQQIQELKAQISYIENKNGMLEKDKTFLCEKTQLLEAKLSSLCRMLWRICGIQPDGSIIMPRHNVQQVECNSNETGVCIFEIEQASLGMKALMHYINELEREQEILQNKLSTAEKKLLHSIEQEKRIENKVCKIQSLLNNTQQEKINIETKYAQKLIALKNIESILQTKIDEIRTLHGNKNELEYAYHELNLEKKHCEDHIAQYRQTISCLENENITLKQELSQIEAQLSKTDLKKTTLEEDMQHHIILLQDKNKALEFLQEKVDSQSKFISSLEECCDKMKLTIDQLKCKAEQAVILESQYKVEIKKLQKINTTNENIISTDQEKLNQVQESLINSENERRVLNERLEASHKLNSELKRLNQSIQFQLQKYQEQISNLEVQKSKIESQLKLLRWRNDDDSNTFNFNQGAINANGIENQPTKAGTYLKSGLKQVINKFAYID